MRLVALGASNLTLAFPHLVAAAREAWGDPLEVFSAHGLGRSYGIRSAVLVRRLPGILECGLWPDLARRDARPTRAVVTDIGNDIVYGVPVPTILSWIAEAVDRLQRQRTEIVLTGLPVDAIAGVDRARFLLFRTLLFPGCRLSLDEVRQRAAELDRGLQVMAAQGHLAWVRPPPEWYGVDPVHIRRRQRATAWRAILRGGTALAEPAPAALRARPTARAVLGPPQQRWICGIEQRRGQPTRALPGGTSIWLY